MNLPLLPSFKDYQAKYETSSYIPEKIHTAVVYLQKGAKVLHTRLSLPSSVLSVIQSIFGIVQPIFDAIQASYTALKKSSVFKSHYVSLVSTSLFSCFTTANSYLVLPKTISDDLNNIIDFLRGFHTIDRILKSEFSPKSVITGAAQMILFVINALNVFHRLKLIDITTFKTYFTAIPIFGVLPFGGLKTFSLLSLVTFSSMSAFETKRKIEEEIEKITSNKLKFWSKFSLAKVEQKENNCVNKIIKISQEISSYKALIREGKTEKERLDGLDGQTYKKEATQQALEELKTTLGVKQQKLHQYKEKIDRLFKLDLHWKEIDAQKIEDFRHAKELKWTAKLQKANYEKTGNRLTFLRYGLEITKKVIIIGAVVTGYGVITLPLIISIGFDSLGVFSNIGDFFLGRKIKNLNIESVKLAEHFDTEEKKDSTKDSTIQEIG